ncbi:MAG: translation initiation factor IF-2 [Lachnospiraceae bacterium]|nr:translation initiation factor IF-2 [Lachnospiraceae bacterium]
MAKMRIHELSKELNISSKDIIAILSDNGIEGKTASSGLEEDQVALVRSRLSGGAPKTEAPKKEAPAKETSAKEAPKAEEKPAKEAAAKPEAKPVPKKKPASQAPAEAPKKKKNITVVVNSQYSKNGNGQGGRGHQDRRPRPGAERRGPAGQGGYRGEGHSIIKPRPESERTRRSEATNAYPEQPILPAPEHKPAERPAPERKPVEKRPVEKQAAENRPARPENAPRREAPASRPERPADKSTDKARHQKPVRPKGGQQQQQGGSQPNANKDNQRRPDRNKKGKGGNNKQDRDALGKKQESFINLEKNGGKKKNKPKDKGPVRNEDEILTLILPERMTIKELSDKMLIQPSAVVKKLFMKGQMVTVNQSITYEEAEEIALEFNCVCEPEEKVDVIAELLKEDEEDEKNLVKRPPVVCVMGHVDHGKTSLLDAIRDTRVTDREAGGITQKIGAYGVSINGEKITFLDTPGHEAFTAMRMRGANSTDIAILVVAADDGVMPQTVEAINHAKAAGIEIIVAINKIDKPGANVDRVKQELSEYELIPADWGGTTEFVPVSAKTGQGIDDLLETILLTSEILELKSNPKRNARGLCIEAELDKGRGVVATVLVQKGTLKVGDPVAAGSSFGKVRAMIDEHGRNVKKAGPSTAVEILGLSEVPNAGEIFVAMDSEKEARSFAETFVSENKNKLIEETRSRMSLDDLFSQIQAGNLKELDLIVKADVQGSVEAVKNSLEKLSNDEVVVKVIHGGVGAINESDVILASASNAIIIGFNVRIDPSAKQTADHEGVDVRLYNVIYNAIEDVESAMKGMLEPIYEEKITGHAEIRQIFTASGVGNIAGSYVTDGNIVRDSKVRITRGEEQIFEGALASLKRFKDDVKEVKSGYECGLVFDGFDAIAEGDIVEAYIMVEVPRS